MKVCTQCKIIKDLNSFHRNRRTKDGLNCVCKVCAIDRVTQFHKRNKENYNNYIKYYYHKLNPNAVDRVKETKNKMKRFYELLGFGLKYSLILKKMSVEFNVEIRTMRAFLDYRGITSKKIKLQNERI